MVPIGSESSSKDKFKEYLFARINAGLKNVSAYSLRMITAFIYNKFNNEDP